MTAAPVLAAFLATIGEFFDRIEPELGHEALGVIEAADPANAFDAGLANYEARFRVELDATIARFEQQLAGRPRSDRRTWKAARAQVLLRLNVRVRQHLADVRRRIEAEKLRYAATGDDFAAMVADLYDEDTNASFAA